MTEQELRRRLARTASQRRRRQRKAGHIIAMPDFERACLSCGCARRTADQAYLSTDALRIGPFCSEPCWLLFAAEARSNPRWFAYASRLVTWPCGRSFSLPPPYGYPTFAIISEPGYCPGCPGREAMMWVRAPMIRHVRSAVPHAEIAVREG